MSGLTVQVAQCTIPGPNSLWLISRIHNDINGRASTNKLVAGASVALTSAKYSAKPARMWLSADPLAAEHASYQRIKVICRPHVEDGVFRSTSSRSTLQLNYQL